MCFIGVNARKMREIKVAAAVIFHGRKVFATQRGYGEFAGYWEFPGGKLEVGETAREALEREIREELDVELDVREWLKTVEYDYVDFHLSMECFVCEIREGEPVLREHKAAKWLGENELNSVNWLPADRDLIDEIQMYFESKSY